MNLKERLPSRDEFSTFIAEAMNIVNHTPLWNVSSDPKDPMPLCPAMLLNLRDNPDPPPVDSFDSNDISAYGRLRWKRVQFISDCFWQQWRKHYLHSLQERKMWLKHKENLKINDIVLLKDKAVKRNLWPTGVVIEVKRGRDTLVRSALIKTADGKSYTRPISELILLIAA